MVFSETPGNFGRADEFAERETESGDGPVNSGQQSIHWWWWQRELSPSFFSNSFYPIIPFLIQDRQVYIQDGAMAIYKFKIDNVHSRLSKLDFWFKTDVNSVLTYFKTWQALLNIKHYNLNLYIAVCPSWMRNGINFPIFFKKMISNWGYFEQE